MKILLFIIPITLAVAKCNNVQTSDEPKVIYKLHKKTGEQDIDTLWVSQNDTTVFSSEETVQSYPEGKAKLVINYQLKTPQDETYYFIYNTEGQLAKEGKYTAQYVFEGKTLEGNFYNSKTYYYKKNGILNAIHFQVDGRNQKIEHFDSDRQLTKVTWFNKKSGEKDKEEIYKNGRLKETRVYTAFDVYHTVK